MPVKQPKKGSSLLGYAKRQVFTEQTTPTSITNRTGQPKLARRETKPR